MKFKDIAKRLKIILIEMSDNRAEAIDYLKSQSRPYTQHICKILLWGSQNEQWLKDWSDEVYNYITNVNDVILKGNKRLKLRDYEVNFIYKNISSDWELERRLEQTKSYFIQKDNYPEPEYVNSYVAFNKYNKFANEILQMINNDNINYKRVLNICKLYLTEGY